MLESVFVNLITPSVATSLQLLVPDPTERLAAYLTAATVAYVIAAAGTADFVVILTQLTRASECAQYVARADPTVASKITNTAVYVSITTESDYLAFFNDTSAPMVVVNSSAYINDWVRSCGQSLAWVTNSSDYSFPTQQEFINLTTSNELDPP